MAGFRHLLVLLHLTALVAGAQTHPRFVVSEKQRSGLKDVYGQQAERRLDSLLRLMDSLVTAAEEKKVASVNRFFNQLAFSPDSKTWNKSDYWASRLEFLGQGRGDCEDFAVAKYLTMSQLGIAPEKLFLTYVKAIGYPEAAHLVVTYYQKPGAIPLVLDNYDKRILPASRRKDLVPVYSFTADELFIQKQQGLGRRVRRGPMKTQKSLQAIDWEIRERGK